MWRDLQHGLRMFLKNPGFTLTAILSLAFGTGANVAMFSVADALLLRPLPVPHPREIMSLGAEHHNDVSSVLRMSNPDYLDLRNQSRSFEGLFAYGSMTAGVAAARGAPPQVRIGAPVTGNMFDALHVEPRLGRPFRPDEDQVQGRDAVTVLSYALWRELGADPALVGRTIQISGIEFTVIGVAPEEFTGPDHFFQPAFYVPAMMWPRLSGNPAILEDRAGTTLRVKGRLKPATSFRQAQAELDQIATNLERAHPGTNRNRRLILRTELQTAVVGNKVYSALAAILTLLSGAVLVVACANVAGLLTSRAPLRAKEIALRMAVGAGRIRLIRQLLMESSLIALSGGVLGLPLAYAGIALVRQFHFPSELALQPDFELDLRALLANLVIAMGSVILFGPIPAIQTTRLNLTTAFKARGSESEGRRLWGRNALVAAQVAVSLTLLTIAVFASGMFRDELTNGMGFRRDRLAMVTVDPRLLHYDDAQTKRFFQTLAERAAMLPGVKSAALTSSMLGQVENYGFQPEGYRFPNGSEYVAVFGGRIDEHYFDTFGIPIVRGRAFAASDNARAPLVAIINQTLAAHYWPNQNPLGRRFRLNGTEWVEIVGIAQNSHYGYVGEAPREFLYLPYRQTPAGSLTLLAASEGESASLLAPLRNLVLDLDPAMPIYDSQTMEQFYQAKVTGVGNVLTTLISSLGLMGLALALTGLYALTSYSVSRRTREIGIRMAVGADRRKVVRMVLKQAAWPVLAGIAIGLLMSAGAGRWLRASFPLVYDIRPEIYWAMALVLLMVALGAAFAPARRASRIDPMTALRED